MKAETETRWIVLGTDGRHVSLGRTEPSEAEVNDHKGAGKMNGPLPPTRELQGDRGYDSDGFSAALAASGITPCIAPRRIRRAVI